MEIRAIRVVSCALLVAVSSAALVVAAQERKILPAPAPAGGHQAWLHNETTARFMAWAELEQQWEGARARPEGHALARVGAAVCLKAASLPTEGEGKPGRRAALMQSACPAALGAMPGCYAEVAEELGAWSVGFERPATLARTRACGSIEDLQQIVAVARKSDQPHNETEATERLIAEDADDRRKAEAGRRALAMSGCEQVQALTVIVLTSPAAERPGWELLAAVSEEELARARDKIRPIEIRYIDVAGYHLAEAKIALYEDARDAYAVAIEQGDVDALEGAQERLACVQGHRDVKSLLAAVGRKLKAVRAEVAKEETCQSDPGCMARREVRERREESGGYEPQYEAAACCKICSKGKACGDTCISRSKTCHVGAGCACDG